MRFVGTRGTSKVAGAELCLGAGTPKLTFALGSTADIKDGVSKANSRCIAALQLCPLQTESGRSPLQRRITAAGMTCITMLRSSLRTSSTSGRF